MNIGAGEQMLFQTLWKPGRDGSQWLELSIVGGPSSQSPTVLVEEPRSDGVFGTISSVNPVLLVVVCLLMAGLVGLLVLGLRRENLPANKPPPHANAVQNADAAPTGSGPYGSPQQAVSPGENPYE